MPSKPQSVNPDRPANASPATSGIFRALVERTADAVGDAYFNAVVRGLAELLGAECAFMSEVLPGDPPSVHLRAFWQNGPFPESVEYALAATPTEATLQAGELVIPQGVAEQFPGDRWLSDNRLSAYIAVALPNPNGAPLGHLGVSARKPLPADTELLAVLRIMAARASAELQRLDADEARRLSEAKFATAFRASPSLIAISDLDTGRFTDVSQSFETVLGYRPEDMVGRTALDVGLWTDPGQRQRVIDDVRAAGRALPREVELLTREGRRRTGLISAEIIQLDNRAYILSAIQDVTDYKAAMQALRAKDITYQMLFNAGNDAVFVYGLGMDGTPGRFIEVNDIACERLGYSREDLLHMTPLDIVAPESQMPAPAPGKRLLKEGTILFETLLITRDGHRIPVESNAHVFRLQGRTAVMSVVRDISERQRAEAIHRSQLAAMEASLDGIAILDDEFRFVYANHSLSELLRLDSDESLEGQPWTLLAAEDERPRIVADVQPELRNTRHWRGEILAPPVDGRQRAQEISLTALTDGGAVCVVRDITERREQDRALREAEEKYRTIFENSVEGIYQTTPGGRIISANPELARILGYNSVDELMAAGQTMVPNIYVDPGQRALLLRQMEEHGSYTDAEFELRKRDGTRIWVSDSARVVRDTDGRIAYYEGTLQNITARKEAEAALAQSEEKYRTLVDTSQDGVFISQNGRLVYVNSAFAQMLGYAAEDMEGLAFVDLIHPDDRADFTDRHAHRSAGEDAPNHYEIRMQKGAGKGDITASVNVGTILFRGDLALTGTVRDITEQKKAEQQLLHNAFHDDLTGLPNRAFFLDRLRHAMDRAARKDLPAFAVLFMDLDRFKLINDSLGHDFGDRLLVEISNRLKRCLRPADLIARHGGDEFTILVEDLDAAGGAAAVAERIHDELSQPFQIHGHELFTNASIGIVLHADHYKNPEELLRDADTAMYRAKALQESDFVLFDEAMHERVKKHLRLETDLRRALDRGELEMLYQPIINLSGMRLSGFEALLRWNHPRRGRLSPDEFLGVAEETGLILSIGRWILDTACTQARRWQAAFTDHRDLAISINIANRQFSHWELPEWIQSSLRTSGLAPASLRLEITENVFIENPGVAKDMLLQLKSLGVALQMDDFGTGYSSLSGIRNMPLDTLKIDRSFIRDIVQDPGDLAIVQTITRLARELEMDVVAEGVENSDQIALLREAGCHKGQGFYFARPMDVAQASAYIGRYHELNPTSR
ncbi:MAG: PAS domain S-box protein [Gammaproteobacteria bacterium]|jgi:diguanylate cyclase (GGDEF)-like protein/PAS domain S-box-containing protein